jgi:hypothetical protein
MVVGRREVCQLAKPRIYGKAAIECFSMRLLGSGTHGIAACRVQKSVVLSIAAATVKILLVAAEHVGGFSASE